ncbi:MAG: SRPBCC family protein [Vicinamibacterales bacterium]
MEFNTSLVIAASPASVIDAFFDPNALAVWWQVTRSVCIPKPLGSYAVEWEPTDWRDATLGRLGGAFHGTVMEYKPGREFFLADAWWLPPDGDPVGPMAVEATCSPQAGGTLLHLRQTGYEESARWTRYYEVITPGWERALLSMKDFLEGR